MANRLPIKTRRERLKSALYLRLEKLKGFKIVKGGPFGLFKNPVCCKMSKKLKGPLETLKKFREKVSQNRKGRGKSRSAEKIGQGGPYCFGIVLYFMLEALDAFKMKY